jgi:alkylhydroperoxidase/carboxymuconolactone decarboxylase family protein YurZ
MTGVGGLWMLAVVSNSGSGTTSQQKEFNMPVVGAATHQTLSGVSSHDVDALEDAIGLREASRESTGLDERTFALVKIATLIALDAPPASYAWQVGNAIAQGVTPEDILGVLRAVAPQVGGPKVVAAAPEIMVALGLDLDEEG